MKKKIIFVFNLVLLSALLSLEFSVIDFGGKLVRISYGNNNNIVSVGTMENGKREGYWLLYYDSGRLKATGRYMNDKKNGNWAYHENDSINQISTLYWFADNEFDKYEYVFRDGKVETLRWVSKGLLGNEIVFYYRESKMYVIPSNGVGRYPTIEDDIKEGVSTYEEINPKNIFIKRILIALLILVNVFFLIAHWRKPLHSSH